MSTTTKPHDAIGIPQFNRRATGGRRRTDTVESPEAAYQRGYNAAQAELSSRSADDRAAQDQRLAALENALFDAAEDLRTDAARCLARVVGSLAPALSQSFIVSEIDKICGVSTDLPEAFSLSMHETLAATLFGASGEGMPDRLRPCIETDNSLKPTEIRARWANGGMIRDPAGLLDRIQGSLGAIMKEEDTTK